MPPTDRDPLAATARLIVDGTNLLHAMSRRQGAAPPAALIGRLRGIIPSRTAIELVFDGPPEPGLRNERIAAGVTIRYSGGRSADAAIIDLVDDVRRHGGTDGSATILVVTDDRDLRHGARLRGARTAGGSWLLARLDSGRLTAPSVGNPRGAATGGAIDDPDDGRRGWRPGRGATTKRGNPHKAPKGGGAGRMRP
jgi:YacP-like NYN domain